MGGPFEAHAAGAQSMDQQDTLSDLTAIIFLLTRLHGDRRPQIETLRESLLEDGRRLVGQLASAIGDGGGERGGQGPSGER